MNTIKRCLAAGVISVLPIAQPLMAIAEPVRLNPDTMDSISAGTDLTFQLLVSPRPEGDSSQTGVGNVALQIRSLLTKLQEKHVLDGTGVITTHAVLDQLGQLISSLCGTAPCTIVVGDGKLQAAIGGSGASQTAQLVTYSSSTNQPVTYSWSTNQPGTYSFSKESLTSNSTFNVWSSVVVR
jgi:hypothetical protein